MALQNTLNTLSRRNWLRDAAIAAAGAVVLPSVLTGCTDHRVDPKPAGLGSDLPITHEELDKAATNLLYMRDWLDDLYLFTSNYEKNELTALLGGTKPTDWKDFSLNIFTQIAAGFLQAAIQAAESTLGPFVGPALATADAMIKQFAFGSGPPDLYSSFAEFENSHLNMQKAIRNHLLNLADPGQDKNYQAMQDAFKAGDLEFNGKKYSLRDLANAKFPFIDREHPDRGSPAEYATLWNAAYDQFRKSIWNAMIMKCGVIKSWLWGETFPYQIDDSYCIVDYARHEFYDNPNHVGRYLRGNFWDDWGASYWFYYWYLEFDGKEISSDVAEELFIDDTPGHIMKPDKDGNPTTGLFPRDYVFKQFNTTKTDFGEYLDFVKDKDRQAGTCRMYNAFDQSTRDYEYIGGGFPELIKK